MLFIDVSLYKRELFRILALAAAFQDLEALIRGPLPMAGMVHIRHASLLGGCFFHVGDWDRPWGPQLVGVGKGFLPSFDTGSNGMQNIEAIYDVTHDPSYAAKTK